MAIPSKLNSGGFAERESLSVILPGHNEAHVIEETLNELTTALKELDISYEVIVVDDGTYTIASDFADDHHFVSVISYQPNHGKGSRAPLQQSFHL